MKKILLSFLTLVLVTTAFAQNDYKKLPSLGINFGLYDFKTASDIRTVGLSNVIKDKLWSQTKRMNAGLGLSYLQGVSNHIDFVGTLTAAFLKYPVPNKPIASNSTLLLDATAAANVKLLSDKYCISPYFTLGVGASKYKGYYNAFLPAGLGLQVKLYDGIFANITSQYRIPVTENAAYHLFHNFSVVAPIAKKKVAAPIIEIQPPVIELPKDRDGDGIADADDKCPDVAGIAALQGCPDADGDGITDAEDKCPTVAGLARYQGCPIPDTDKDGINDEEDKCVNVPGVARYQGCPIPDTDKDGVNDEEDKCINEAGPASNFGCPVIEEAIVKRINAAAKNVFFATGSSKLLAKSFKPLNDVVKILKDNPSYNLQVDGHTDNTGKADKNQTLSENRAASVQAYLISKGITEDRLSNAGYGQDKPAADNKTAAGRAKNRRVEMTARNYK
ncbi:MAG: OmpA family protein [Ferruginibacter sp.]|nr:OmpA family protein [Ferruginibacter sp.]